VALPRPEQRPYEYKDGAADHRENGRKGRIASLISIYPWSIDKLAKYLHYKGKLKYLGCMRDLFMRTTLSVISSDIDAEDLHNLTFDLSRTINRETDFEAELAEGPIRADEKGVPFALGIITLIKSGISSGSAALLINVLKSYFIRDSKLEIEIQNEEGRKLRILAQNVSPEQIDHTIGRAREILGDIR
jgi:hypothetical protein